MAELDWDLYGAVSQFARLAHHFSESDLEKPWAWQDYDEGVRHAFFRTYEELWELAALQMADRIRQGNPPSIAQCILAQYHGGFRDLQAILLEYQTWMLPASRKRAPGQCVRQQPT